MNWKLWSTSDLHWFYVCFNASEPFVKALAEEALAEINRRTPLHVVDTLAVDRQLDAIEQRN